MTHNDKIKFHHAKMRIRFEKFQVFGSFNFNINIHITEIKSFAYDSSTKHNLIIISNIRLLLFFFIFILNAEINLLQTNNKH